MYTAQYTKQAKKMVLINILEILKQYSDESHRLSQADIRERLKNEYCMEIDRKTVKANLTNLIDYGFPIEYTERTRNTDEVMLTDFYYDHSFTNEELRIIIDGLLFSKYIPYNRCNELIKKLKGLSSRYFKYNVKHICNLPVNVVSGFQNQEFFYSISVIDEAIEKNRQIKFAYKEYDTNKKLKNRMTKNNNVKKYLVNPYQMVATNGRYYLICNYDRYDTISYYRIDRIVDIELVDVPVKSVRSIKGCENGLNLPQHMAEHIYMLSGESKLVAFRAKKAVVTDVIDWFGADVSFSDETEDEVTVRVSVNANAMKYWAMQYANYVRVISPQSLVDEIKRDLKTALEKYDE